MSADPVAVRVTPAPEPPIVREIVAVTSSSGTASASARPIATVPPAASPFAVVTAFAVWVALSVTLPVAVRFWDASPSMEALVVTVGSAIAASAVRESVEPEPAVAPASAYVVAVSVSVALRLTLPGVCPAVVEKVAPSSMVAVVVSL